MLFESTLSKVILAGAALTAGLGTGLVSVASAQSTTANDASTQAAIARPATPENVDPAKGGHVGKNGTEVLLTGDDAAKAKAVALTAVPGGTIQRVETDTDGAGAYEAHMLKADGSAVTVYMDSGFTVTSTDTGPGGGSGSPSSSGGTPPAAQTSMQTVTQQQ